MKYATTLWDIFGFSIIAGAIISWWIASSEILITGINWLIPPVGEQLISISSNLEIVIPIGVFLIAAEPNLYRLTLAAGLAFALGVIMWLMGF